MMRGENVVCFAKDWNEDPTSNNHVMRELARANKVLWLNSIATRVPSLTSSGDVSKIFRKLKSFAQGPVHIENGLDVYTPIVLPFPHNPIAGKVNEQILDKSIRLLRSRRDMKNFQMWTFLPTTSKYIGKLGESFNVYYCIDEWSHFSNLPKDKIIAMENDLCRRADIVFATATRLLERRAHLNPETHLALHGVDQAHFARALAPETKIADDIAHLPRPVIGFIGLIQDWVDLELIRYLAERRKDWTIVLVGKSLVDLARVAGLPNVKILGRKPYETLHEYCKGFDIGLIPFVKNELTLNVNPIKLREYLSAGLPVVSTDIPEVARYVSSHGGMANACAVATAPDEFHDAIDRLLAADSPAARKQRSDAMLEETWERVVARVGDHVMRVKTKLGK
ncbi:MAG: glycosyltransferase [Proteobacteria bacterium]|nr:glycosyltransferase [Pseudomonadota bacterium]